MQTKLLLVDFDGTLVDTRRANFCAYRDALEEVGVILDEGEYFSRYYGMRCEAFLGSLALPEGVSIDSLRLRKIALYPRYFDSVRLNSWLADFVVSFRSGGGCAWIVSTGQRANIEGVMRHLGILDMFDGVIASGDCSDSKPSAAPFLLAMSRAGFSASESLIFEDSSIGLAAAEASGAAYVRVTL